MNANFYGQASVSDEVLFSIDTDQDDEKQKLARQILQFYQSCLGNMQKKHRLWQENYEFFLGKQWATPRPAYRASEVLNYTFAAIQSSLPVLTDNRPRFSYLPEDPADQELAQYFEKITESQWSREGYSQLVVDMFLTGMIYGTSFVTCKYDPNANSGLGRIRSISIDPFQLYFPDDALDINDGSCSQVLQATPLPVGKVKAMFPDFADKIHADLTSAVPSKYTLDSWEGVETARVINFPIKGTDSQTAFGTRPKWSDRVMVYEQWIDDDTMAEVEYQCESEDGEPLVNIDQSPKMAKRMEKKFPDGRHTVMVNGMIVLDQNNEYADGKYPYAKFIDYQLPQEFYGMSDVDQLKAPQRMINRAVCSFLDNLVIMGNPIWIMDQGAADADLITNAPGLIVEKQPNSDIRREPGMPLPSGAISIYEVGASAFDRIFGSNEVSQGVRVPGVTSGVAIESLQEAAQTRLRLKARNMEKTLTEWGVLFLSRVMQYWTQPQFVSITREGMPPEVFQFQVEKDPESPGWYKAMVEPYEYDKQGQLRPTGEQKKFKTQGLFNVKVTVGSNLPFAKREKSEKALQLFQLGLVDAEEVLKAVDWPGWERVQMRMKEKAAEEAKMMAQAQAAQGAPKQVQGRA